MSSLITIDGKFVEAASALLAQTGVAGLMSSLTGLATNELNAVMSRRLVRFYDNLMSVRAARHMEGKPAIPDTLLMPALRAVIEEDDDDMLAAWAALIAGSEQDSASAESRKIFVRVLAGLTGRDAKLLAYLCGPDTAASRPESPDETELPLGAIEHCVSVGRTALKLGYDKRSIMLSADNLARVACLQSTEPTSILTAEDRQHIMITLKYVGCPLYSPTAIYYPTALAFGLLEAIGALPLPPVETDRRPLADRQ